MRVKGKNLISNSQSGFTVIELMIVLVILAILILAAIFTYQKQLARGRDARRKTDLSKLQKVLEDYSNDHVCYPEPNEMICGLDFAPYLHQVPCDPLNNTRYNYMYTYKTTDTCKKWYKIYTKLEDENDPIIAEVGCDAAAGCSSGCGPGCNYNYWVSSPNVAEVTPLADEYWPPVGAGGGTLPPGVTPTLPPPTSPPPIPTVTLPPGPTPTPTPVPTEPPCPGPWYACQGGTCNATFWGSPLEPKYCDDPCCAGVCSGPPECL